MPLLFKEGESSTQGTEKEGKRERERERRERRRESWEIWNDQSLIRSHVHARDVNADIKNMDIGTSRHAGIQTQTLAHSDTDIGTFRHAGIQEKTLTSKDAHKQDAPQAGRATSRTRHKQDAPRTWNEEELTESMPSTTTITSSLLFRQYCLIASGSTSTLPPGWSPIWALKESEQGESGVKGWHRKRERQRDGDRERERERENEREREKERKKVCLSIYIYVCEG